MPWRMNAAMLAAVALSLVLSAPSLAAPVRQAGTIRADALVLVNSASAGFVEFERSVKSYLDHYGVPYTVVDIATQPVGPAVGDTALIIVGHRQLDIGDAYLDAAEEAGIEAAVNAGTGLVNFDNDLSANGSTPRYAFVQQVFNFGYTPTSISSHIAFAPLAHYITARHQPAEVIDTAGMRMAGVTLASPVVALATSGSQPLLAVTTHGAGRAVQWGSYDWMSYGVKGPVYGLDDLVWRSLVWAARKPFVMQGMPPFVTLRMDDVYGPFEWVHIANEFGFKPWVGVFTSEIDAAESADLSALVQAGQATAGLHAFAHDSFFYSNHGPDWPDEVMASHFLTATQWFQSRQLPISKYAVGHFYEIGSNAFEGLRNWGVEFVGMPMQPGQSYGSQPWLNLGPFRRYETGSDIGIDPGYYAAHLPIPGHPELDGRFFNCFSEIRDITAYEWYPGRGVQLAIDNGLLWLKRGLDSMILPSLFAHEFELRGVRAEDWRTILRKITQTIAPYNPIYVTMDYACQYARATTTSAIVAADYDPTQRRVTTTFGGSADMPTQYYVFTEDHGTIGQVLRDVPSFSGTVQVVHQVPGPVHHIVVSPGRATVVAAAARQFAAQGFDAGNAPVPDLVFQWAVTNGGGAIDSAGVFTAGLASGIYTDTVVASYYGVEGRATAEVVTTTADHFEISPVVDPRYVNMPFQVTISARDASGNLAAGYTGTAALSDTTGALQPATTGAFVEGVWTGLVTITQPADGLTISAHDAVLSGTSNPFTTTVMRQCPCSIWDDDTGPSGGEANNNEPIEVGLKFQTGAPGYIVGLRFYKVPVDTAVHTGHLWTADGTLLAEATFTGETASGWQEVAFATPVAVEENTTYVASYHSPNGYFITTAPYLASSVNHPPLRALASGEHGPNGLYRYGPPGFPTSAWNASNFWVDVVFNTDISPDVTPPTVTVVAPAPGQTGVNVTANITASFGENINAATIEGNFVLRDAGGSPMPTRVSYSSRTRTAALDPSVTLAYSSRYTATVSGGATGVADRAGNRMAADFVWTFTTSPPPPPPPSEGPGGPVLVIADIANTANPFGRYYVEILRAEGFNVYSATDISQVTAATLAGFDTVLLSEMALTPERVNLFDDWVDAGGHLIAFRPDEQLAARFGLQDAGGVVNEGYLLADAATPIGRGIAGVPLQFHGSADRYLLSGASSVATLYASASTPTASPAIARYSHGAGSAVIFTYDLARSIVLTRQGNPDWAWQEGDGALGIRASDMFAGRGGAPDWIDAGRIHIPQADEQMRLLTHAIEQVGSTGMPLPRLWYFPDLAKGALVMTGDAENCDVYCMDEVMQHAHSYGGWYTAYLLGVQYAYADVQGWLADGHAIAPNYDDTAQAASPTYAGMWFVYEQMTDAHRAQYGVAPRTARNRWGLWVGWSEQAEIEEGHGIRFDANYAHWGAWLTGGPGHFTGSGLPMRFANDVGRVVDVFQANTQLPEETWGAGDMYTAFVTLLDRSIDQGYYAFLTVNLRPQNHGTYRTAAGNMMAYAAARGVPIWNAERALDFLQARNQARVDAVQWDGSHLSFDYQPPSGSQHLTLMLPAQPAGYNLQSLRRNGAPITYTVDVVKGYPYAFTPAISGSYDAQYVPDTTPPQITHLSASPIGSSMAVLAWLTDEAADSRVDYGISPAAPTFSATAAGLVTAHAITLTGLSPETTYYYRATSADAIANALTAPAPPDPPISFTTPAASFIDTSVQDFSAGSAAAGVHIAHTADGELMLAPAVGAEFDGASLPAGWFRTLWDGGSATVGGGMLAVDGALAGTDGVYGSGRSVEFVATFRPSPFQHAGLGVDLSGPPWAIFGTGSSGAGLQARTSVAGSVIDTDIPGQWLDAPHRYRIDWGATRVVFAIDGVVVATHTVSIGSAMRPLVSDSNANGVGVSWDWLRMGPYAAPATTDFVSRVFDAGRLAEWLELTWAGERPEGTGVAFATRSGGTPAPDAAWSDWAFVGSPVASPNGRYIQYRATLSTTDSTKSPAIEQVSITYRAEGAPPPSSARLWGEIHTAVNPPAAGEVITGRVAGVARPFTTTVAWSGTVLTYQLEVPGDLAGTPEKDGAIEGDPITITIGSRIAALTAWHGGASTTLNLHPPHAVLTHTTPAAEGTPVTIDASPSQDLGGDIAAYAFDCDGDGLHEIGPQAGSTTGCAFSDDGDHMVEVRVIDSQGGEDRAGVGVRVNDVLPRQVDGGGPYTATAGQAVTLTGSAVCAPSDGCAYTWDLDGDGAFAEPGEVGATVAFARNDVGVYTATLRVMDDDGNAAFGSARVTVGGATHEISLAPGWNLVSFQVRPANGGITHVLGSLAGQYDLIYAWDGQNQRWLKYDAAGPAYANTLNDVDGRRGVWIHTTASTTATLSVVGSVPVTTEITLHPGWNLAGYPSGVSRALPEALSDHGVGEGFTLIYAYHTAEAPHWRLFDRTMVGYPQRLTALTPGWGYWIWIGAGQRVWTVPYVEP